MNTAFALGLLVGMSLGSFIMYQYIHAAGLFRTRKEFYAARHKAGLPVPENWDQEDE